MVGSKQIEEKLKLITFGGSKSIMNSPTVQPPFSTVLENRRSMDNK